MISIIIPCYNVEETISNTLDSIISQTCTEWEIITVNDGSKDNTLEILKLYKNKLDGKLKIINQENMGVSFARNTGLKNAIGDYVYFLDGDDIIDERLVQKILNENIQSDIFIFSFKEIFKNVKIFKIKACNDLLSSFLIGKSRIHICSTVYNRGFLINNNLLFEENTCYSEDREFIANSLLLANKVTIIDDILYNYIRRETSAMGKKVYDDKRYTSIEACERIFHKLEYTKYRNAALIQLKTTLTLHWKMACKYNCMPMLKNQLREKMDKYLNLRTVFSLSRDALFANISSLLYKKQSLFDKFVNIIP